MKQLLIVLMLAVPALVAAQPSNTLPVALLSEKDYYQKMYEAAKDTASSATTVTWCALAAVLAVIPIAILLQGFLNYRLKRAELETIRAEIQTQQIASQAKFLRRLSEIATEQLAVINERTGNSETRLREAINRELDSGKERLKEAISSFRQVNALHEAEIALLKKNSFQSLRVFVELAENQLATDSLMDATITGITNSLKLTHSLELSMYERIVDIQAKILSGRKHDPPLALMLKKEYEKMPVYRMNRSSEEPYSNTIEYVMNAPS